MNYKPVDSGRAILSSTSLYHEASRLLGEAQGEKRCLLPVRYSEGYKGLENFLKECVWTYDEAARKTKKLPDHEYIFWIARHWYDTAQRGEALHILKSRRLVVSWLMGAMELWAALSERTIQVITGIDYDASKEFVWRSYFMYTQAKALMPELSLPPCSHYGNPDSYKLDMLMLSNGSSLIAENSRGESLRGSGFARVRLEEASTYPQFDVMMGQAAAVTQGAPGEPRGHVVSVSNQSQSDAWHNFLSGMRETKEEAPYGCDSFELAAGGKLLQIHYSADPLKRNTDWVIAEKSAGWTSRTWALEMEMDATARSDNPVFPMFQYEKHTTVGPIPITHGSFHILGLDCGTASPRIAGVLFQITPEFRQVQVIREWVAPPGSNMDTFTRTLVADLLAIPNLPLERIRFVGDETGRNRQGATGTSSFDIALSHGINIEPISNNISVRIASGSRLLTDVIEEQDEYWSRLVIDREACPALVEALSGGYQYKIDRLETGQTLVKYPLKDRHSDIADAFTYGSVAVWQYIDREKLNEERGRAYTKATSGKKWITLQS